MPDNCESVPQDKRALWVDLHHLLVLLTDLETVRDFMLEPEYTQEEATANAVFQIKMMIYHLEHPDEEWTPLPDNPEDMAKMFS